MEKRRSSFIHLYTDGACSRNPGPAAAAWLVLNPVTGEVLAERGTFLGDKTNNVAEYTAIIKGLTDCLDITRDEVHVFSDSEFCINQILGKSKVKKEHLKPLHAEVIRLGDMFRSVGFTWLARENEWTARCDRLAKDLIKQHRNAKA